MFSIFHSARAGGISPAPRGCWTKSWEAGGLMASPSSSGAFRWYSQTDKSTARHCLVAALGPTLFLDATPICLQITPHAWPNGSIPRVSPRLVIFNSVMKLAWILDCVPKESTTLILRYSREQGSRAASAWVSNSEQSSLTCLTDLNSPRQTPSAVVPTIRTLAL